MPQGFKCLECRIKGLSKEKCGEIVPDQVMSIIKHSKTFHEYPKNIPVAIFHDVILLAHIHIWLLEGNVAGI